MNRAMAELRSTEPKDGAAPEDETWLERIGEKFGDFLAEPSAGADRHRHPVGCLRPRAGPGRRAGIVAGQQDLKHRFGVYHDREAPAFR